MEQLATINCVYDFILYLHMHCRQCNDAYIQQVIKNNRSPCPFFENVMLNTPTIAKKFNLCLALLYCYLLTPCCNKTLKRVSL